MQDVNFLIKPASGLCNMRCRYCFYADEMQNRTQASAGLMTQDTAAALIRFALASASRSCTFAFQGGEPTLAGLDFFRSFVAAARAQNEKRLQLSFAIQTNGYALDDEWALFLAKEHFLVGVSLDGYAELHDLYRRDAGGAGTAKRALQSIRLLEKYGAEFNILTVITAQTAKHAAKLYRYYEKCGLRYQQYIPCLDPLGAPRGSMPYSLTPALYGEFLTTLFDAWYADVLAGKKPYNRYFENLTGMLLGQPPEACGMLGHCTKQLVVEADGRIYPCDFYVLDGFCIGDVHTDTLPQVDEKRVALGFIEQSLQLPAECRACEWFSLCRGGCRRDRDTNGVLGRSCWCEAYRRFFPYAVPRLARLAEAIRSGR